MYLNNTDGKLSIFCRNFCFSVFIQYNKSYTYIFILGLTQKILENTDQEVHTKFRSFKSALKISVFSDLRTKSKQLHVAFSGKNLKGMYSVLFKLK